MYAYNYLNSQIEQLEAELEFMKTGRKGKSTFYDQDASYHDKKTGSHHKFGLKGKMFMP